MSTAIFIGGLVFLTLVICVAGFLAIDDTRRHGNKTKRKHHEASHSHSM